MIVERAGNADAPPGILRSLVAFHETQSLGAGTAVLRVVAAMNAHGWTLSGWIPGDGPLTATAQEQLAAVHATERPFAFSGAGWREGPGVLARARATPDYLRSFARTLRRVRPHVVHANTLLSLPEALVARRFGLPIVVHVHEIPDPGVKRTAAIRAAASAADVLVAVSDAVAAILRPHAGRTPVLTVRNGVPAPASTGLGIDAKRPFTVGTIGTVSLVKGTDVFLEAAARVAAQRPDIRFDHVGAPDLHRDRGLDERLSRLRAGVPAGALTMHGAQTAADLISGFDVLIVPSRSEAFPLVVLEAMAAGVPVIASSVGGIPEQIEHGRTGVLVPPGDPGTLADWIVRLHDDPGLRVRLADAAGAVVRADRTIQRQADELHHAYLVALNRRFGPPLVRRLATAR